MNEKASLGSLATPLTDDEFVVLSIAHEGQSMIPIGRWEKPTHDLADRGYLHPQDGANYVITAAGRAAWKAEDKARDQGLGQVIEMASRVGNEHRYAAKAAETSAQAFAEAVRVTMQTTGEPQEVVVARWENEILKRTMDLLRNTA